MSASHLIQILLPKATGAGEPISQVWFDELLKELTREFGGATSFVRAPAQGLWRRGGETERDNIAVVEVMTDRLVPEFWRSLRKRLEAELSQEEMSARNHSAVKRSDDAAPLKEHLWMR